MLGITDRAGEVLNTILEHAQAEDNQCVRLDLSRVDSRLAIDREHPGDEIFTFRGKKVLAVDPYAAEECAYRMLDCKGTTFFFTSPASWLD